MSVEVLGDPGAVLEGKASLQLCLAQGQNSEGQELRQPSSTRGGLTSSTLGDVLRF